MDFLARRQDRIIAIIAAHVHTFEIRAPLSTAFPNVSVPLLMSPSISPLHENNPGYSVLDFKLEDDGSLTLKHEMRFLQLNEYQFEHSVNFITTKMQERFNVDFLSASSIRRLGDRLETDIDLYKDFQILRMGYSEKEVEFWHVNHTDYVPDDMTNYICAMKYYELDAYKDCVGSDDLVYY
jgi:hypothetical protein